MPLGYELFTDVIDGYSFLYPAEWVQVRVRPACSAQRGATADECPNMSLRSLAAACRPPARMFSSAGR